MLLRRRTNLRFAYCQPLNKSSKSLFSARYGQFRDPSGIGYIRRILNPFTLQAFNMAGKRFRAAPYAAIYVSGTDTEGLISAYAQMMDNKMLEGVVLPMSSKPAKTGRFRLGGNAVMERLPEQLNGNFSLTQGEDKLFIQRLGSRNSG